MRKNGSDKSPALPVTNVTYWAVSDQILGNQGADFIGYSGMMRGADKKNGPG
jgi:hypothetical protein